MTKENSAGRHDLENRSAAGAQSPSGGGASEISLTTALALAGTTGPVLSARERETMEGLEQLDRHLSGLYRLGLELSPRSAEPGVAYLIAHAGRELGLGVVRLLSGVAPAFAGAELKRIAKKEKYRAVIAKMLGVPPESR